MAHASPTTAAHGASPGDHGHGHHITPVRKLVIILAWLAALTGLTVWTGKADWIPGVLHVPVAMLIATVKVYLVVSIFMGLKHDNRVNGLAFIVSIVFVLVFLTFTMFDVLFRGDLGNVNRETIRDERAILAQDSVLAKRYETLLVAPGDSAGAANAAAGAPADSVNPNRPPLADTTRIPGETAPAAAPLDTTSAQ